MSALVEAMLAYAQRGWPVFVLSSSKTPVKMCDPCRAEHVTSEAMEACECLTCHGFYAATRNPDRLAEMAKRYPRGLVAIRTGAPSGTVVVDVDPPHGFGTLATLEEAGVVPPTLTAQTGSGGEHRVYAHPGIKIRSGAGKLGHGVDAKADGAYIVVAPSIHPKSRKPYRWTTPWETPLAPLHPALVDQLKEPPPPDPAEREFWTRWSSQEGHAERRFNGLIRTVQGAPMHQRNDHLYWAATKAGEMVATGEIDERTAYEALRTAGLSIGLTEREIGAQTTKGTIGSGLRAGRGET